MAIPSKPKTTATTATTTSTKTANNNNNNSNNRTRTRKDPQNQIKKPPKKPTKKANNTNQTKNTTSSKTQPKNQSQSQTHREHDQPQPQHQPPHPRLPNPIMQSTPPHHKHGIQVTSSEDLQKWFNWWYPVQVEQVRERRALVQDRVVRMRSIISELHAEVEVLGREFEDVEDEDEDEDGGGGIDGGDYDDEEEEGSEDEDEGYEEQWVKWGRLDRLRTVLGQISMELVVVMKELRSVQQERRELKKLEVMLDDG